MLGQPNVNISVDRAKADRYGINVADVQDAIQTAVGGNPVSQILIGEERFDLVPRYQPQFRSTIDQIKNIRLLAPSGERVSLAELCKISVDDGASMIYRESNQRYIAIKYSVRGRDLGSTVEEAMKKVDSEVKLPPGYTLDWAGEYESQKRANHRLATVVPLTILVIIGVLYSMFRSFKWSLLVMLNLSLAPIGGLLALWITGTHFSVSTGVGFLALFGVSVQTGVIMVEHINQLRARGLATSEAAVLGALRRLRPIMMTMLVASLGLIPAALSHGIGSDSQRPFAIVIVGGLLTELFLSLVFLPVLVHRAGRADRCPAARGRRDLRMRMASLRCRGLSWVTAWSSGIDGARKSSLALPCCVVGAKSAGCGADNRAAADSAAIYPRRRSTQTMPPMPANPLGQLTAPGRPRVSAGGDHHRPGDQLCAEQSRR